MVTDELMRGWIRDGRERSVLARVKESEAAEAGDAEAATAWRRLARALETKALEVESWWDSQEPE
ncbi:MAG: hypothetical protein HY900_22015 [Deltaproteobacteria bacterium]|nr:hypothetical protein [Deltaproteobacteria bacterium]